MMYTYSLHAIRFRSSVFVKQKPAVSSLSDERKKFVKKKCASLLAHPPRGVVEGHPLVATRTRTNENVRLFRLGR